VNLLAWGGAWRDNTWAAGTWVILIARVRFGGGGPLKRRPEILTEPQVVRLTARDIVLRRQDDEDIVLVIATLIADDQLE
jgi:hypothetical protein